VKSLPESFCYAKLPNAGLGNKLFVWAKALVFARLNHLPLVVTGWTQFQLAPILLGGDFRFYWNYFNAIRDVNIFKQVQMRRQATVVQEPPVCERAPALHSTIYEFHKVPHWSDYFGDLKPHRELIREELFRLLRPARMREYKQAVKSRICIQVRLGDFQPLAQGVDFAKVGSTRTPLDHFRNLIEGIRQIRGSCVGVTIVSDGSRGQLQDLLTLPEVNLGTRQTAIVDILRMACSQVLVPSAGSTFGYWAGFLGDSALIMHPDHIHQPIRPDFVNHRFYEGPATGPAQHWPALLQRNIQEHWNFSDGLGKMPVC